MEMPSFPVQQNRGGPLRELCHQLRYRAEAIMEAPTGEIGRVRGLHVIAMIERSGSTREARRPGFFDSSFIDQLAVLLEASNATLQPQESRFREIMEWHDPDELRGELRSNLLRLVGEKQETCVRLALDMHALHDLYMRHHNGPGAGHLNEDDLYAYPALREALGRAIAHVPEIAWWTLPSTVGNPRASAA